MNDVRVTFDIPEMHKVDTLMKRHEELLHDLRKNLRDLMAATLVLECKMNQPAVSAPTDSGSHIE